MSGETQNSKTERALDELLKIKTLDELRALVGKLTPEEQARIDEIDLNAPLTEEDLHAMGLNFKERIMEAARRHKIISDSNERYAEIMGDPESRQEELDERAVWDATLADGLDEDEDEDN